MHDDGPNTKGDLVSATQPNIVVFFWDNLGWGEVGSYGGGILRGAATPRIDALAGDGMRLLNFNVEAQCTPSRSALLTGRHPLRSGTQTVPITGGPDGLTRWEITSAQALSDAGYATGMWGKWHLGSDPDTRSPVDFGFDEAVWSPRTADEVFWTMQSYFPDGTVTATPTPVTRRSRSARTDLRQEERRSVGGSWPPMTRSSAPGSTARSPAGPSILSIAVSYQVCSLMRRRPPTHDPSRRKQE